MSLNGSDHPASEGEFGVLKVSAVTIGKFRPEENKAISTGERVEGIERPLKGHVIVSRANTLDLVGASALVPSDFPNLLLSDKLWQIKTIDEKVDASWLGFFLASPEARAKISARATGTGAGMKNISQAALLGLHVDLPPLDEQRRIVAVLSTWDRGIEEAERLLALKEQRKRALMQQLLTGKRRFPEYKALWKTVRLGEVLAERNETDRGDLPLLSITADRGVIPRTEIERKDTSNEDKGKYKRIAPGDIGYNTMRMWQGVSAVSALEGLVSPAYTVCVPRVGLDACFAGYLFKNLPMIHMFYRHSQGLVDDTRNLKYEHFKKIRIALPSIEEQRSIAAVLNTCDDELRHLRAQVAALKQQKKGLMQKLLTGQVRVPVESRGSAQ